MLPPTPGNPLELWSPPRCPWGSPKKDRGTQAAWETYGDTEQGRPGQDPSGQLPRSPPPTILCFWAEASWLTLVPISRPSAATGSLKITRVWAGAVPPPSEGG